MWRTRMRLTRLYPFRLPSCSVFNKTSGKLKTIQIFIRLTTFTISLKGLITFNVLSSFDMVATIAVFR